MRSCLRDFLAKPVSNRFKQSFRHGTSPRGLLGCAGQVETAGDDADLSTIFKSMSIFFVSPTSPWSAVTQIMLIHHDIPRRIPSLTPRQKKTKPIRSKPVSFHRAKSLAPVSCAVCGEKTSRITL